MIATQVASPFLAPFKLALYLSVYLRRTYDSVSAVGFYCTGAV